MQRQSSGHGNPEPRTNCGARRLEGGFRPGPGNSPEDTCAGYRSAGRSYGRTRCSPRRRRIRLQTPQYKAANSTVSPQRREISAPPCSPLNVKTNLCLQLALPPSPLAKSLKITRDSDKMDTGRKLPEALMEGRFPTENFTLCLKEITKIKRRDIAGSMHGLSRPVMLRGH